MLGMTAETEQEEQEVLALFFATSEEKITQLEHARRDGERTQWKAAAHYLKGAAANLGLSALAEQCQKAERAERRNKRISEKSPSTPGPPSSVMTAVELCAMLKMHRTTFTEWSKPAKSHFSERAAFTSSRARKSGTTA